MRDGKLVQHALADFATLRADRVIYDGGQPRTESEVTL